MSAHRADGGLRAAAPGESCMRALRNGAFVSFANCGLATSKTRHERERVFATP
jgi:hypothetical protein